MKLLRVLQDRRSRPGEESAPSPWTRASSRPPTPTSKDGRGGHVPEDLYYRLNVIPVPSPLRDREEDILPLTEHFLERFNRDTGKASQDLEGRLENRYGTGERAGAREPRRAGGGDGQGAGCPGQGPPPGDPGGAASLPATGSYGQPPAPQAPGAAVRGGTRTPGGAARRATPRRVSQAPGDMERDELQGRALERPPVGDRAGSQDPRVDAAAGGVQDEEARGLSSPWKK